LAQPAPGEPGGSGSRGGRGGRGGPFGPASNHALAKAREAWAAKASKLVAQIQVSDKKLSDDAIAQLVANANGRGGRGRGGPGGGFGGPGGRGPGGDGPRNQ